MPGGLAAASTRATGTAPSLPNPGNPGFAKHDVQGGDNPVAGRACTQPPAPLGPSLRGLSPLHVLRTYVTKNMLRVCGQSHSDVDIDTRER